MREKRTIQPSIFEIYPEHDIGRELKAKGGGTAGCPRRFEILVL